MGADFVVVFFNRKLNISQQFNRVNPFIEFLRIFLNLKLGRYYGREANRCKDFALFTTKQAHKKQKSQET